ncbi:hypothetical protein C8R46DRAFT_906233 [Mycena filopes]|nr:hypothetical protein C8R46DRAFT_906233 [Mycena filopes]
MSVLCRSTSSTTPCFPSAWARTRTHIILIGSYKPMMHEVDAALVPHRSPLLRLRCLWASWSTRMTHVWRSRVGSSAQAQCDAGHWAAVKGDILLRAFGPLVAL